MSRDKHSRHLRRASHFRGVVFGAFAVPLLLSLGACAQGGNLADLSAPTAENYHLGPGDQIRVITYDEPQLTNTFTVGADGKISFPLVGRMDASGATPNQFASELETALRKSGFLSQPSVSVEVAQYRPISVLGEVNHPGQYPYQPGMTMLDAVALAGGFTYRAVTGYASDWRSAGQGEGPAVEGKISPGSKLQPGDVITIYERYF